MANTANVIIRNYTERGRNFTIVQDKDGFYLAIEDKYIDKTGKLTQTLYGHQMFANRDMNECIKSLHNSIEINYLVEQGHSKAEAFAIVFDLIGKVEMDKIEALFA